MHTNELAEQRAQTNHHQATSQGRTLEGSGGRRARFWTRGFLHGNVVTFGLEGRETNWHQPTHTKQCTPTNSPSNVHQPTTNAHQAMHTNELAEQRAQTNHHQATWQGRTLEGSGGRRARFWTRGFLHGNVVTFGLEGRETNWHQPTHTKQGTPTNSPSNVHQPTTNAHQAMHTNELAEQRAQTNHHQATWQGRTLEDSGGRRARFWTRGLLHGNVVTFGLEGRETLAGACSRGLWRQPMSRSSLSMACRCMPTGTPP